MKIHSNANYALLGTEEQPINATVIGDSRWYPGYRRTIIEDPPSEDVVLIKTGGNALQAVPRRLLQESGKEVSLSVVVPNYASVGTMLFVIDPITGTKISTTVPEGVGPGHSFLVQIPQAANPLVTTNIVQNGKPLQAEPVKESFLCCGKDLQLAVVEDSEQTGGSKPRL